MKKKLEAYSELLYHLINFRTEQFLQLRKMIRIDYDSFMILSVMGSHYLKNNKKLGTNWDDVWEDVRTSKTEEFFWSKALPEQNAMYVQFNLVAQKKELTLMDFNLKLREDIKQSNSQNLIFDLRFNSGGDGSLYPPMLKTLIEFEIKNPEGKIFVLIGRGTFSAAQNLLSEITKFTNAILVGEPSGSKPSFIGESGWFKLPFSGLMGIVASQYHQPSKAEDFRKWIAPHIPVNLSSTDYFNGNDKALNVIMEVIKTSDNGNKN